MIVTILAMDAQQNLNQQYKIKNPEVLREFVKTDNQVHERVLSNKELRKQQKRKAAELEKKHARRNNNESTEKQEQQIDQSAQDALKKVESREFLIEQAEKLRESNKTSPSKQTKNRLEQIIGESRNKKYEGLYPTYD